jgi:hypothetical protein
MNDWLAIRDMGFVIMWSLLGIITLIWIIIDQRERSFQAGYWKGRQVGWQMHRRMIDNKNASDQVFDYDKD